MTPIVVSQVHHAAFGFENGLTRAPKLLLCRNWDVSKRAAYLMESWSRRTKRQPSYDKMT